MDSVDCLQWYIQFGNIDSSNSRIWYISLYVCIIFYFFHNHLKVSWVQVFCILRQVYSQVFYFFAMIVNEIFFYLISISNIWLLVYRTVRDFCVLILYFSTLPNSLMSINSIMVPSLGFLVYGKWQFYLFFSINILFSKISMTMTPKPVLNKSDENGYLYLPVPDFRGHAFRFSKLRMFSVGLLYMAVITLR